MCGICKGDMNRETNITVTYGICKADVDRETKCYSNV